MELYLVNEKIDETVDYTKNVTVSSRPKSTAITMRIKGIALRARPKSAAPKVTSNMHKHTCISRL